MLGALVGIAVELGAPGTAGAQAAGDLQIVAVDASRSPLVAIDVAVPEREASVPLPPGAFRVQGGQVLEATRLDPADLAVGLVFDDAAGATRAKRSWPPRAPRWSWPATSTPARGPQSRRPAASPAQRAQTPPLSSGTSRRWGPSPPAGPRSWSWRSGGWPPSCRRWGRGGTSSRSSPTSRWPAPTSRSWRPPSGAAGVRLHVVSTGTRVDPAVASLAAATGGSAVAPGPGGFLAAVDALDNEPDGAVPARGPATRARPPHRRADGRTADVPDGGRCGRGTGPGAVDRDGHDQRPATATPRRS